MDASIIANETITAIYTFGIESVHPAWINEWTTRFATSMSILKLSNERLVRVLPCEVVLNSSNHPSLGLSIEACDADALKHRTQSGKAECAQPLSTASFILPFAIHQIELLDPLQEGAVSEIKIIQSQHKQLLFRHVMPPMTLGIDFLAPLAP